MNTQDKSSVFSRFGQKEGAIRQDSSSNLIILFPLFLCKPCLRMLKSPWNAIKLSLFLEKSSRLMIFKRNFGISASITDLFNPGKIAHTRTVARFPTRTNVFDQSAVEIRSQIDCGKKRFANNKPMKDRKLQKNRQPKIGTVLVFHRATNRDVFISVSPIGWQNELQAFDPFGKEYKMQIGAHPHHFPCVHSPFIRIL